MRGNERYAPRSETWYTAAFPIPMRGNELRRVIGDEVKRRRQFPIPMRGNETVDADGTVETKAGFPIPMRGNEVTVPVVAICVSLAPRFRSP